MKYKAAHHCIVSSLDDCLTLRSDDDCLHDPDDSDCGSNTDSSRFVSVTRMKERIYINYYVM